MQIKTLIFFIFLPKTQIVGTRQNRLGEAVLTSTHNLCFRAKIIKIMYTPVNPSYYIKVGFKGVNIIQACFRDVTEGSFSHFEVHMTSPATVLWLSPRETTPAVHPRPTQPHPGLLANGAEPDQMPQNISSDQRLHCLQIIQPFYCMMHLKLKLDSSNIQRRESLFSLKWVNFTVTVFTSILSAKESLLIQII